MPRKLVKLLFKEAKKKRMSQKRTRTYVYGTLRHKFDMKKPKKR